MNNHFFDIEELKKRPVISLSGEQHSAVLMEAFLEAHREANQTEIKANETKLIYGLAGLRRLLNCSQVTAQRIKNSGKLKGCFYQSGRKIVFDEAKVLTALKSK